MVNLFLSSVRHSDQRLGTADNLLFIFKRKHFLSFFNLYPTGLIDLPIVIVYIPRPIAQQLKINVFVEANPLPALL